MLPLRQVGALVSGVSTQEEGTDPCFECDVSRRRAKWPRMGLLGDHSQLTADASSMYGAGEWDGAGISECE